MFELRAECIQYQHDITDQEQRGAGGKDPGKSGRVCNQVSDGDTVKQRDPADVNNAEYLERRLCRDLPEDPNHQQPGQHNSRENADQAVLRKRKHCGQVQDVAG